MASMKRARRDAFRVSVFERDGHRCVICGADGQDAHHIMERRLFDDGGYVIDNGATLCGPCHIQAEQTVLTCDEIRQAAGIGRVILPDHLYSDTVYDKWGDVILPNGQRIPGELFDDESVRAIMAEGGVLDLFTWKVKYPRTMHLPWSSGITADDRVLADSDLAAWEGADVVVTEKMDGQNTTLMADAIYSRSVGWKGHPTRSWVANFHAQIAHEIPWRYRVCGENLWAQHTIHYDALPSFFLGFAVWDALVCLSWDDTVEWFELLGVQSVPVVYRGPFSDAVTVGLEIGDQSEGYVVRPAGAFRLADFRRQVAKFVRPGFIEGRKHWRMGQRIEPNKLE